MSAFQVMKDRCGEFCWFSAWFRAGEEEEGCGIMIFVVEGLSYRTFLEIIRRSVKISRRELWLVQRDIRFIRESIRPSPIRLAILVVWVFVSENCRHRSFQCLSCSDRSSRLSFWVHFVESLSHSSLEVSVQFRAQCCYRFDLYVLL